MKRLAVRWGIGAIAVLFVLVLWTPTFGQAKTENQDVLGALLVEVRGLRASMEQLASAGPRVQLAVARLQLQEQRLNTMLRRLDDVRDRLNGSETRLAEMQAQAPQFQESGRVASDPEQRLAFERMQSEIKAQVSRLTREVQQHRAEFTELSAAVAAEQGRWVELNQRLEDLDRTLGRR